MTTKHRVLGIAIIVLAVAFISISGVCLNVMSQCYSNEYWWVTRLSEDAGLPQMVGIGLATIIAIPIGILLSLVNFSGKTTVYGTKALGLLIVGLLAFGLWDSASGLMNAQSRLDKAEKYTPGAYQGNEAFIQETLESIQENDDECSHWLLYIGRSDCDDCKDFEATWEKAYANGGTSYSLSVYDTTLDRNGAQAGEMQAILNNWNVTEVPCVIELKDDKATNTWTNPSSSIKEIEAKAKSCNERTNYINAD